MLHIDVSNDVMALQRGLPGAICRADLQSRADWPKLRVKPGHQFHISVFKMAFIFRGRSKLLPGASPHGNGKHFQVGNCGMFKIGVHRFLSERTP